MATEMRNDDSGMTAASVRQFKKIIDNRIAKSVPKPVRSRKAVVKRIDTDGTVWADIIGGEGSTPIEVVTTTTVPGDVIDVRIQDGKAYGSAASENPTVTTSYLGEVLQMMASASKGDTVVFDGTVLQVDNVLAGTIQAMEGSFSELRSEIARINKLEVHDFKAVNAQIVDLSADTAKIHSLTAEELSAATAYIAALTAENISVSDLAADHAAVGSLDANYASIGDLNAATARIGDIEADYLTASDMTAEQARVGTLLADYAHITNGAIDNATIGYANVDDLDAHYAQIDGANITSASAREAWIDQLLVQTQLLATDGTIFTLDAVQVDAANITTGTLDVRRLIITRTEGGVDQKYLVEIDPQTSQPVYVKMDGNVIEPRTIGADKIIANSITADEITIQNIQGTGGWINLHDGTFLYYNATTGGGISWDGEQLLIGGSARIGGSAGLMLADIAEKAALTVKIDSSAGEGFVNGAGTTTLTARVYQYSDTELDANGTQYSYQWYLGGTAIQGATAKTYTASAPATTATYTCEVVL